MVEEAILAVEEALRQAMLAGDVAALDGLIAEELVFTTPSGAVIGKGADLDAHRAGRLRLTTLAPSERRVLTIGPGMAVVSVRMAVAGTFEDVPFAGDLRYTRVWVAGPGGWRVAAGHVSPVLP